MAEVNGLEEHLLTIEELLREGGGGEPTNLNIQNGEAEGSLKQKVHSPSLVDGAVVNPTAEGLNSTALGTSSVDALTAINEYGGFALTSLAPVSTVTSVESLPEPGTAATLGTIYRVNDTQNGIDDLYIAVEVDGTPDWSTLADYIIEVWGSLDPNKFALALGETSTVTGHNCIALRKNASAQGNGCVASGHSAVARGTGSHALGDYSVAEGLECVAYEKFSHASGDQTEASGRGAHSDGIHTTASGQFSETSGYYTTASNYYAHAEGESTTASGRDAHAEGLSTLAYGDHSHAEGAGGIARGNNSHSEGWHPTGDNSAVGGASHAEGDSTVSNIYASHAEGQSTTAGSPITSYAYYNASTKYVAGDTVRSSNNLQVYQCIKGGTGHPLTDTTYWEEVVGQHAEGLSTQAIGSRSHAEGYLTKSGGKSSHAEGDKGIARGENSHIEGSGGVSVGTNSHTEGWHPQNTNAAIGNASHAEGDSTVTTTYSSHAEGYATKTAASSNPSSENFTDSSKSNYEPNVGQHVAGRYNVQTTGARVTGNGTADGSRSNAEVLDWNGNLSLAGNLTLGMGGNSATLTPALINQIGQGGGGGVQLYLHTIGDTEGAFILEYISASNIPLGNETSSITKFISTREAVDSTGNNLILFAPPTIEAGTGDEYVLDFYGLNGSSALVSVSHSLSDITDTVTAL